jgi:hypothetical protein
MSEERVLREAVTDNGENSIIKNFRVVHGRN